MEGNIKIIDKLIE
jgi:hypothetical protein